MSSNIQVVKICSCCGNDFIAKTTVTKFCGKACNSKFYKTLIRDSKIQGSNLDTAAKRTEIKADKIDQEYLTVNDVAHILGMSRPAVYRMINNGTLKATNLMIRGTRVLRKDLDQLFFETKVNSKESPRATQKDTKRVVTELQIEDCYSILELIHLFGKTRSALYTAFARASIPKKKSGKEVYFEKIAIDKLLKKQQLPKQPGLFKDRITNQNIAKQGLKISQCYTIDECTKMFEKDRSLLYGIFNRRLVPKIRDGHKVLVSKKVVDKLYKAFKKEGKI
ncbi:helix-turn-helix domain-containing protein [Pedobacter miscanthi]|jgi:excisionase family DNA binding protein|uniref:helix-turn-helix domain-containing protein n=1 Tax=Pedobacter miscanthi TaxID=2259170 RepID=UPI00292DD655|nr:helix-turn-helix domain-containing protein [Pedobacter miscanthi]